jgi:hypothetical protein
MFTNELHEMRRTRWRLDGNAARTGDELRDFVEACGLCLLFPARDLQFPTFIGAFSGSGEKLPSARQAFADPRAQEARMLLHQLVRNRQAYLWPLPEPGNELVIAASAFPFFYSLAADFEGGQQPTWASTERLSWLAQDAWTAIRRARQPLLQSRLREMLGPAISPASLERALRELWARLRIMPIEESEHDGAIWESVVRWAPSLSSEAQEIPRGAALSALLSQYLESVVAAEPADLETTFSFLVSRSQTREAISALQAEREVIVIQVDRRRMLSVRGTPTSEEPPRPERKLRTR